MASSRGELVALSRQRQTRANHTPLALGEVATDTAVVRPSGLAELDRLLGGGLLPGSVTLLGGEPGIGKSTLALQLAAAVTTSGRRALVVSAEETASQVRRRAERLGTAPRELALLATTSLHDVLAACAAERPELLVLDSIQTIVDPDLASAPGSVGQVSGCAARLVALSKELDIATVLVGHVTKDGALAGPKLLEHLVDTVCAFDGDRRHELRLLSVSKHRFGPSGELGVFTMTAAGLVAVPDPSGMLLADRRPGVPGNAVVPVVEGRRPLLAELQTLVASSPLANPRRAVSGVSASRLSILLAVLEQRAGCRLAGLDVFTSVVGGLKVSEPAADLALALALASAQTGRGLPDDVVACGEIGLGGEVRRVSHLGRRLAEAARFGFACALVPAGGAEAATGLRLVPVSDLREALELLGLAA